MRSAGDGCVARILGGREPASFCIFSSPQLRRIAIERALALRLRGDVLIRLVGALVHFLRRNEQELRPFHPDGAPGCVVVPQPASSTATATSQ